MGRTNEGKYGVSFLEWTLELTWVVDPWAAFFFSGGGGAGVLGWGDLERTSSRVYINESVPCRPCWTSPGHRSFETSWSWATRAEALEVRRESWCSWLTVVAPFQTWISHVGYLGRTPQMRTPALVAQGQCLWIQTCGLQARVSEVIQPFV